MGRALSTSYDIHCLECGEWIPDWRDPAKKVWDGENTNFDDCRDGKELERCLTEWRAALETMGMAMKGMRDSYFLLGSGDSNNLQRLAGFFGHHAGHNLEVRDEYGRSWAQCLEDWARWEAERAAQNAALKKEMAP